MLKRIKNPNDNKSKVYFVLQVTTSRCNYFVSVQHSQHLQHDDLNNFVWNTDISINPHQLKQWQPK